MDASPWTAARRWPPAPAAARRGRGVGVRRGRYLGGVGGQADFCGAAARTGARSIIALRSTAGDASTIVAARAGGTVTTARADVDTVVTEHGVAHLRGCPLSDRAERLVAIAAPRHREAPLRGRT